MARKKPSELSFRWHCHLCQAQVWLSLWFKDIVLLCRSPGSGSFLQAGSYSIAGASCLEGTLYKAYSSSMEVSGCLRYCDSSPLFLLFCSCCLCINLSIHDLSHHGTSLLVLPTNSPLPWLLSTLLPWGTSWNINLITTVSTSPLASHCL